ncbi:unnamed protein product [Caenorhabditis auriculariae]|uniref:PB1 domain-containing protein n=1 Tax=Caenorhabditis auriculariae TaxID=2777116 RepID=A0A8S1HCQ7_9PELO|nr:unnamed protein product [Caenorhabditis auriculariae]
MTSRGAASSGGQHLEPGVDLCHWSIKAVSCEESLTPLIMSQSASFKLFSPRSETSQRFSIAYSNVAELLESLKLKLQSFGLKTDKLCWIDEDNDQVLLKTADDLQEAINLSAGSAINIHSDYFAPADENPAFVVIDSDFEDEGNDDIPRRTRSRSRSRGHSRPHSRSRSRSHSRGRSGLREEKMKKLFKRQAMLMHRMMKEQGRPGFGPSDFYPFPHFGPDMDSKRRHCGGRRPGPEDFMEGDFRGHFGRRCGASPFEFGPGSGRGRFPEGFNPRGGFGCRGRGGFGGRGRGGFGFDFGRGGFSGPWGHRGHHHSF